jgi:hypothetical protein
MGRKKTGRTSVVKIASELARKAKAISADKGISMSEYLSDAIQVAVTKDWPGVLTKLVKEASGENLEIQTAGTQTTKEGKARKKT